MSAEGGRPEWVARRERSNVFTLRLITWIALALGRPVARAILPGICLYFMLLAPAARDASRRYLERALGRKPTLRDAYRHFHAFAAVLLDRVFLLKARVAEFDVRLHGEEAVAAFAGRGCILLGAHLGSFEVIRALGRQHLAAPASMVMYEENARKVNAVLYALNPELAQKIIPLGRPDSMLKVRDALQRGEYVGLLADRVIEGEGGAYREFLGRPAKFADGPMRMAAMLRAPVLLMVGIYRGGNRYDVHFERLADFGETGREERDAAIDAALDAYVAGMARYCRNAPYNWFNFFDFWR